MKKLILILILFAFACGGDDDNNNDSSSFSLVGFRILDPWLSTVGALGLVFTLCTFYLLYLVNIHYNFQAHLY